MSKKVEIFQVDAFTSKLYGGNPAAVLVLSKELDEDLMQKIAAENNLAETAFVVPIQEEEQDSSSSSSSSSSFEIRWFTPTVEISLCGHATLASAHVLFNHLNFPHKKVQFISKKSGPLSVTKEIDGTLSLNFPLDNLSPTNDGVVAEVASMLNSKVIEVQKGKTDYLAIVENEKTVRELIPDLSRIATLPIRALIVSSQGDDEVDFVSRVFAPQSGILEDPVTGSSHTSLTAYWTPKLEKKVLRAKQLSVRGGDLICSDVGEGRVRIAGNAVTYLVGNIWIPE